MVEDFNQTIDDCLIIDFDPNFPLKKKAETEQERRIEIKGILEALWNNGTPAKKPVNEKKAEDTLDIDFDVRINARKQYEKNYGQQLTALDSQIMSDPDLLSMLVVGFVYTMFKAS